MKNIYKNLKAGRTLRGLARVSAILIMMMVWILIDKGNVYGQSLSEDSKLIAKAVKLDVTDESMLKSGGGEGDLLDDSDEGTDFQVYPNPVKQDLVFDFEFTVKEAIPYEVISALGRLVAVGEFEPGVTTQELDFSRFQSGMYIIRLTIDGKSKVKRVIRE